MERKLKHALNVLIKTRLHKMQFHDVEGLVNKKISIAMRKKESSLIILQRQIGELKARLSNLEKQVSIRIKK